MRFIVDLEIRENLANPTATDEDPLDSRLNPDLLLKGSKNAHPWCHSPETWADAVMESAEKYGYDDTFHTRDIDLAGSS